MFNISAKHQTLFVYDTHPQYQLNGSLIKVNACKNQSKTKGNSYINKGCMLRM